MSLVQSHIYWITDCRITHFTLFFIIVPLWGLRSEVLLCHFKESVVKGLWVHHMCEFESKMEKGVTFYWFFSFKNISLYFQQFLTAVTFSQQEKNEIVLTPVIMGHLVILSHTCDTRTQIMFNIKMLTSVFWSEDWPCHLAVSSCLFWSSPLVIAPQILRNNQKRPYFQVFGAGKVKSQCSSASNSCNCIFDTI